MKMLISLLALILVQATHADTIKSQFKTLVVCRETVETVQWEEVGIVYNRETHKLHAMVFYHDGIHQPRLMGNRELTRTEKDGIVTYADEFNTTRLVFDKSLYPMIVDFYRPQRSHRRWPCQPFWEN